MFRKDAHNDYTLGFAALLALTVLGAGAHVNAAPLGTVGAMHVDSAVSVSYASPTGAAPRTITSNTADVVVSQTAGVLLSPVLGSQRVGPAARSVYPVTVKNTGTGADTYALSVVRTLGWGVAVLNPDHTPAPPTVTLAAGASRTFLVALTPPSSATRACSGMAVLKAVSAAVPSVYGQAAALTNCAGN